MINKVTEALSKAIVALANAIGPTLNKLLDPLWKKADRDYYRQGRNM